MIGYDRGMIRRFLLPVLLTPFLLHSGDSPRDRATLKGAKAVSVIIDALPSDFGKEGITSDALHTRLTNRLRDAGIPVDDAAKEFVGLRVSSIRDTRGPYAVSIALGFYQPATLVRDTTMRVAPQTWDSDIVLMAAPKMLSRAASESVDDLADRFIAAWRSVNGSDAAQK